MDIIQITRELGKALQEDERYIAMSTARQKSDEDSALQEMIGNFNLKRLALNNEASAQEPNNEKITELNNELRELYNTIMTNENMVAFDTAKKDIDVLLQRVTAIIAMCADGQNPETADYDPTAQESSCGGDCGSCGGCH